MIEFKEYQEQAYISLYWTSLSIPKEIISPIYLYYPVRVAYSPYNVALNHGPSIPVECTATSDGLVNATVGKLSYIYIQSRNYYGKIIDNADDNYQLYF